MTLLAFWKRLLSLAWMPLYLDSPEAPQPDPAIGRAAEANAEIGKEALDFAKQQYADTKPRQAKYDALVDQVVKNAIETQNKQTGQADDYYNYMMTTFRPLEESIVKDAKDFDTEARREELAAAGMADAERAASIADATGRRDMARAGVNPADGAFADYGAGSALNKTIAKVGVANTARVQARQEGRALKFDAAGLGRGLPGAGATSTQLALGAGSAATGAQAQANAADIARGGVMTTGFNTAVGANQSAGSLYSGLYQGKLQAYQADTAQAGAMGQGLGTIAGMALYKGLPAAFLSSKKAKRRSGKVNEDEALRAVKKTPVDRWKYKGEAMPDDQAEHIGPYAEDFQRNFKVGDGKTIAIQDAIGANMAATKGLAKQVDNLERKVTALAKKGVKHG